MNNDLWLNEAMVKFKKKFYKEVLNIVNAPAGCGKSTFIFNEFLTESYKYVDHLKDSKTCYGANLNKILYVCDTNMLKCSILQENRDKYITKRLEKDDLKEAMKTKTLEEILEGDVGYIKVITYSTLGWLLQQDSSRYIILNHLDVILMDEMHNLFKYASRFDSEENNKPYGAVISYLSDLVNKSLVIALSATTGRIYNGVRDLEVNTNTIFTYEERKQIKQYKQEFFKECKYMINEVKRIGICKEYFDKHGYKTFIYTNTIRTSQKYKKHLESCGYRVEWLCSINNTIMNEDGEFIPKMNDRQLEIRSNLILTGMLPDDLDVIIVNSGYETGWNLRDERVQFALIDTTDDGSQIQARNRIRHDIVQLTQIAIMDEYGEVYEYGNYRQLERKNYSLSESFLKIELQDKYLNTKLSKQDKEYLVNRYAIIQYDKQEANWKTFKKDLEANDYIVKQNNHGTYIQTKKEFINLNGKIGGKITMKDIFIKWLENEWDKKRIACQDIIDVLDIGKKTFAKIISEDEIKQYFKEHRYTIGTIKNGSTKYLMKY